MMPPEGLGITFENPEQIERFIVAYALKLIVFDAWDDYLGATGNQVYEAGFIRSRLNPLVEMARNHDCTILIVRHLNRKSGAKASERGTGSQAIRNVARHALIAGEATDDGAYDRSLSVHKSNLAPEAMTMLYRIEETSVDSPVGSKASITAPRVVWGDLSSQTADETVKAEASKTGRKSVKGDQARTFLEGLLGTAPRERANVHEALIQANINDRTARRALTAIGGRMVREGFGGTTWWLLAHQSREDIPLGNQVDAPSTP